MKTLLLTAIFILLLSCNQVIISNNKLALNSNIEKLGPSSEYIVQEWDAYQNLESNLKLICNTKSLNATSFRERLMKNIKAMELHIPKPFNTRDVKNRLESVDRQISSFYYEVHEDELSKSVVERHVKNIMDAFGKLNQTLNRTLPHSD